jgi:hypothetical protein
MATFPRFLVFVGGAWFATAAANAATFTVNKAGPVDPSDCAEVIAGVDDCWFGDALQRANANPDFDNIEFQLDVNQTGKPVPCSTGVIQAAIVYPLEIDGFTQTVPGLVDDAPRVDLDGAFILHSSAEGSVLRGLVIAGRPQYPVISVGSAMDVKIEGNWIGFTGQGLVATGAAIGISCFACTDLTIGTRTDLSMGRNVIAGIAGPAIELKNAAGVTIQNNWLGLNPDGSTPLPNQDGVVTEAGGNMLIGGRLAGERNVIAESSNYGLADLPGGHGGLGIYLNGTSSVQIHGNFVGTNAAGTEARLNRGGGIRVEGANSQLVEVGGDLSGEGNVISGNGDPAYPVSDVDLGVGVWLGPFTGGVWKIQGNKIGTNAAGTAPIPNLRDNIVIVSAGLETLIGGTGPNAGNRIAHSLKGSGVVYGGGETDRTAILGNLIYDNKGGDVQPPSIVNPGLAIARYGTSGPVLNDGNAPPYDTMRPVNYPVLAAASSNGVSTQVSGVLRSQAGSPYRIEFFSNSVCDPKGYGEGENLLGAYEADSDALGELVFDTTLPAGIPNGHTVVTATTTRRVGPPETSEFSACVAVPEPSAAQLCYAAAAALVGAARMSRGSA